MENIVQSYLEAEGYILGENLFKEIEQNEIEEIFLSIYLLLRMMGIL